MARWLAGWLAGCYGTQYYQFSTLQLPIAVYNCSVLHVTYECMKDNNNNKQTNKQTNKCTMQYSYLLLPVVVAIIIIIIVVVVVVVVVAFVANKYVDLLWKWNYFLNGSFFYRFCFIFVAFCTVLLYYGQCFEFFHSVGVVVVFVVVVVCCLGYG